MRGWDGAAGAEGPAEGDDDGCHSAGVGGGRYGEGGTRSASDTPRSMSGMWSQCPWGSPALRRGAGFRGVGGCCGVRAEQSPAPTGVSNPFAIQPGLAVIVTWVRRAGVVAPYESNRGHPRLTVAVIIIAAVQRALREAPLRTIGRHVPFTQHGR